MAYIDITGQRFGRLVALKYVGRNPDRKSLFLFKCDCGGEKITTSKYARTGKALSCGCLQRERASTANKTHGDSGSRLHRIWRTMHRRCNEKSFKNFEDYGGRGISVCVEWGSFSAFREWASANGYADTLSIDRINNNGNYEPSNCRWVDQLTQCQNRRPRRWAKRPKGAL